MTSGRSPQAEQCRTGIAGDADHVVLIATQQANIVAVPPNKETDVTLPGATSSFKNGNIAGLGSRGLDRLAPGQKGACSRRTSAVFAGHLEAPVDEGGAPGRLVITGRP